MQDFKQLPSNKIGIGGIQYTYKAANGYGASIVKTNHSCGGSKGF